MLKSQSKYSHAKALAFFFFEVILERLENSPTFLDQIKTRYQIFKDQIEQQHQQNQPKQKSSFFNFKNYQK